MNTRFDDLFALPLFSDADRDHIKMVNETISGLRFPKPEANGEKALTASVKLLGKSGLLKHTVADRGELNLTAFVLCRELLAYHSIIGDLAFVMQSLGSLPVQIAGSDAMKKSFLPGVISGDLTAAFALSEPNAGSDAAAVETRAEKRGNSYIINGNKRLISNAGVATHYVVFARTAEGPKGVSAFFVPAETKGLSARQTPTMTPHPLGQLEFKEMEVPIANLIGKEGDGLKLAFQTLARGRPSVGAAACGFARRAIEEAIRHASRRKAFGGVLADQQLVQSMLATSVTELDASRLLIYRAAKAFDMAPKERHDRSSAEAKWYATEAAQRIIDRCQQLAGGPGVLDNCILADLYRAIRPLRIYEGASEVQQLVIARDLLGENVTPMA
ncbi:MAG: acyl-CoA dehydrogenase family protein [Planctomycetaceae bacterium]|nr:acyl-CoA dehydrogenase family protein [Planctomycetaceae bacterium]